MIQIRYADVSNFQFVQAVQKLGNTATDGHTAYKIRKIMKALQDGREKIAKEYTKEVIDVFAKRNESGAIIRPEGDPNGFSVEDAKQDEFQKVQDAFGERTVDIEREPLSLSDLKDFRFTAMEQESLKGILDDSEEPKTQGLSRVK